MLNKISEVLSDHLRTLVGIIGVLIFTHDTFGVNHAVGFTATNGAPKFSYQYLQYENNLAANLGFQGFNDSFAALDFDVIYIFGAELLSFSELNASLYMGLGSRFLATKARKSSDETFVRMPLGLQYQFSALHLQLFAEYARVMGPLPLFEADSSYALGFRVFW